MAERDFLAYGKRRALSELRQIFACQWENGMLPQIRFVPGADGGEGSYRPGPSDWGVTPQISGPTRLPTSGITQPPITGLCVWEVFQSLTPSERAAQLPHFLAFNGGLQRYHAWLLTERDPWGDSLALCLHPWETGTDNSPAFESLNEAVREHIERSGLRVDLLGRADTAHVQADHRPTERDYHAYFGLLSLFRKHDYRQRAIIEESPFVLHDVLFNTLLAASLLAQEHLQEALAKILDEGRSGRGKELRENACASKEAYEQVAEAVRRNLWHEGDRFFYASDRKAGRLLRTPTVSGFAPLLAGVASAEQAALLIARLADPARFGTTFPIPATSQDHPSFDPIRYWSGPSWPVTNWLVVRGLRERGSPLAEPLRLRTLQMIAQGSDPDDVRRAAMGLMRANSVGGPGEEFTTPSTQQYQHGWLWDSAIAALCWPLVDEVTEPPPEVSAPQFWEYYHPHTGAPLGAASMTWTAALYLDLLRMEGESESR